MQFLFLMTMFGLATGIIGKAKGGSFWIWFTIGLLVPGIGLIAVILHRSERDEPERQCPSCRAVVKLYVQVCPRCGTDLYLPEDAREIRDPRLARTAGTEAAD